MSNPHCWLVNHHSRDVLLLCDFKRCPTHTGDWCIITLETSYCCVTLRDVQPTLVIGASSLSRCLTVVWIQEMSNPHWSLVHHHSRDVLLLCDSKRCPTHTGDWCIITLVETSYCCIQYGAVWAHMARIWMHRYCCVTPIDVQSTLVIGASSL